VIQLFNAIPQVQRRRQATLSDSEIMTILIYYQFSKCRDFKAYYTLHVVGKMQHDFPSLVSYSRFVRLIPRVIHKLALFLHCSFDSPTGIAYIDSTEIPVCHKKRIANHKVFAGKASIGKSSKGWFLGFKLHLLINHKGGLLGVKLSPGNVDDREPVLGMAQNIFGKLFGDKGYISKELTEKLRKIGVSLFTAIRSNMKPQIMTSFDRILLRKRPLIESVNNVIKNFFEVEHTRHRNPINAFCHMICSLIAYCLYPHKPKAAVDDVQMALTQMA